jgi:hypothetical protein
MYSEWAGVPARALPAELGIRQLECKHNQIARVCARIAPTLQQSVLDGLEQCRETHTACDAHRGEAE